MFALDSLKELNKEKLKSIKKRSPLIEVKLAMVILVMILVNYPLENNIKRY